MTGSRELQTKTEQLEKVNMQNADSNSEAANDRRITIAEKLLRIANRSMNLFVACLMTVLFLYGGYSLWDTWRIYHSALPDQDLMKLKPVKGEDSNPSLQDLQKINADVCAWLTVYDTGIDYPVVRGKDDMEYINKDVYGDFALSGAIFLQSANQPDFSDPYNLIYGHHMSNGAMFGDVVEFADEEYFATHETGTLYLPGKNMFHYIFCLCGDRCDGQPDLWIYRGTGYDRADAAAFAVCSGTCGAVSGHWCNIAGFCDRSIYLCGICHKRKGGVIWKTAGIL